MKHLLINCLILIISGHTLNAQGIFDPTDQNHARESMAAYESQTIYFQMINQSLGGDDIVDEKDSRLNAFPELKALLSSGQILNIHQEFKVLAKRNEAISRVYKAKLAQNTNQNSIIEQLERLDYIVFSEKIPVYHTAIVPNDTDYGDPSKRWHLDQIGAEAAWDLSTGCSAVKIAIVDDAILTSHLDLNSKIYTNTGEIPGNGIDDDGNGYIDDVNGFDVADNDNNPAPPSSVTNSFFTHGTHVAGIAAGASNNSIGNASIGYNSMIVPVKTKSNQNISPSGLNNPMAGVEYAIAAGVDVINMSWGSYGHSNAHQLVFNQAYSDGIVCVAAAGNDGQSFIAYPADYTHVISVGATDQNNDLASFSNISSSLDIFAPGVNIWSTLAGANNNYGFLSGTSMSSPIISGLAALMICHTGSPSSVENCIHNTADTYNSNSLAGYIVRIANAPQALQCTPPTLTDCSPDGCELIANGSFEFPSNSNISLYGGWGAIADQDVCGWTSYHGTADCFPLAVNTEDNYGHILCDGINLSWEGMVSNSFTLVSGQSYQLEFDYAVSASNSQAAFAGIDSIVISLIDNGYTFTGANQNVIAPTIQLDAILNPPVDFTYNTYQELHNGIAQPHATYHHYTLTFTAPTNLNYDRLVIYPQISGGSRKEVEIDNVSLQPIISVNASVSVSPITAGSSTNLNATGSGTQYIWEPADEFINPIGASQTVTPDSTTIYIVTAYDSLLGCSSSDTVIVHVIDPLVTATQPNISLCCSDGPITFGTEWILTGNVYWTNDYFTPTHGYPAGINAQIGGEFTNLPPCGVIIDTIYIPNSSVKYNGFKVYKFDPCDCGPGVYPITYAFTDSITGQTDSATMNITVGASPVVSFPTMTINLCASTSPVAINPLTSGVSCSVSGSCVSQGSFYPACAGVGTHSVQITCQSASGCTTTITGTIIVEETENWHNTTSKAVAFKNQGDAGNDIYAGEKGFVYSTGHFYEGTTFSDLFGNDIVLTSNAGDLKHFYTVCYNKCGELQWVVYDEYIGGNHFSDGFGIGKSNGELYVGLNFRLKAKFTTVYPNGTTYTFAANANGGSSNIGDICLIAIDGPGTTTFGHVNAIKDKILNHEGRALYSDNSGSNADNEFYICGKSDTDNNFVPKVFYSKYKYSASSNQFGLIWERRSEYESSKHIANDIVWDNVSKSVFVTGRFTDELSLFNGPGSTSVVSTSAVSDAFFAMLNPNGYLTGLKLNKLDVQNGEEAEGTTITTTDNGYLYVGGNYLGETNSPFQNYGVQGASSYNNSSYMNSFLFSYELASGDAKFESIWNKESYTNLTGIDELDNAVSFTGYYGRGVAQSNIGTNAGWNPSSQYNQVFTGRVNPNNGNWHMPKIVNSTLSYGKGNHLSTRTTVGYSGFAFFTGTYTGYLSYQFGNPVSGDLFSTTAGTNPLVYNAFYLRSQLNSNELKTTVVDNDQSSAIKAEEFEIIAFPNPTNGITTVKINGKKISGQVVVELYNPLGEIIYKNSVSVDRFEIDISKYDRGIYILKVKFNDSIEVLRIVKS